MAKKREFKFTLSGVPFEAADLTRLEKEYIRIRVSQVSEELYSKLTPEQVGNACTQLLATY